MTGKTYSKGQTLIPIGNKLVVGLTSDPNAYTQTVVISNNNIGAEDYHINMLGGLYNDNQMKIGHGQIKRKDK